MSNVLVPLLQTASLLVVSSWLMGFIFDRTKPGAVRDAAVGLFFGLFALAAMMAATHLGAFVIDGRSPFLIAAGLFGGPVGAALAVPLTLAMRLSVGGPAVVVGCAAIVGAAALGVVVRLAYDRWGRSLNRSAVLSAATASPLLLLVFLLPQAQALGGLGSPIVVPLLGWLPFATLLVGFTTVNELVRSDAERAKAEAERFQRSTEHVAREMFETQLKHHWHLNARYGVHYAYMLVAVDDGPAMRAAMRPEAWKALRERIAKIIGDTVRESDICCATDFDRFAVLMPHTSFAGVISVAERIQTQVAQTVGRTPAGEITVSVGIAGVGEGQEVRDIEAAAEGALYLATARDKRNGLGTAAPAKGADEPMRSFPGGLMSEEGPLPPNVHPIGGNITCMKNDNNASLAAMAGYIEETVEDDHPLLKERAA